MISNRARLYFTKDATSVTLKIGDRAYKSGDEWAESVGNLSKKNYKKFVQDVADRVIEINSNPLLIKKAIKNSKLIHAFNPINLVGNIEWKLLRTVQTENNRPILTFNITNKGSKEVVLTTFGGEFEKLSGIGTARLGVNWEKPDVESYKKTTSEQLRVGLK